MRIVSLLPSATEIICAMGLGDKLVGVSHECDYPEHVRGLPGVTTSTIHAGLNSVTIDQRVREQLQSEQALYHLRLEVLESLKPDLIVTQALCDVCAVAASEVEDAACGLPGHPQIVNLEPMTLAQVFDTLELVGAATGRTRQATRVRAALQHRVDIVAERSMRISGPDRPRVGFLEWIEPLFNAGHWTPELIDMAGGIDCLGSPHQASRTLQNEELIAAAPELLFIAQCGFDMQRSEKDLPLLARLSGWQSLPCVTLEQLYYCDGNAYFSRPGPRLVDSLEILAHTLHPAIHPLPAGMNPARRFDCHGNAIFATDKPAGQESRTATLYRHRRPAQDWKSR